MTDPTATERHCAGCSGSVEAEYLRREPCPGLAPAPDLLAAVKTLPTFPNATDPFTGRATHEAVISRAAVLALIESRSLSTSREAER